MKVPAPDAVAESERYYRTILESASDSIIVAAANGRLEDVNDASCKALGYTRAELVSLTISDIVAASELARIAPEIARLRSGEVVRSEWWIRRKDGTLFPVEVGATVLPDGRLLGILRDITERRRAEETRVEAEARLRLALTASNVGLFDWDLRTNHVAYSREWKSQIGYEEHEISNDFSEWESRCHPDDLARVLAQVQAYVADSSQPFQTEFRFRHRDGHWLWILTRAEVIRDATGLPVRMLGCHVDITERKRAEKALAQSEDRYRDLVEHSQDLICTHDLTGRILSINPWAAQLLGRTIDELLNMSVADVLAPERRHEFDAYIETIRRDGVARGLMLVATATGERRVWDYNNTLRTEGVPSPIVRGMAHDVTERRAMEDALQLANHRLQSLSRRLLEIQDTDRRQLARELHDEVGQMLTAIKMKLENLKRFPERDLLAPALDECIRVVQLTLDQVRTLTLDLRPPMLDHLGLSATLRWLAAEQTRRSGLHVRLDDSVHDKRFAPAVETACFRVAQEAIHNLVKHSGAKSAHVELGQYDGALHLRVRDDGAGFDVRSARLDAGRGATLGLLGMEERATLAGGGIEWISAPARGTEVHAWFPV